MGPYAAAISEHPDSAVASGEVIGHLLDTIGTGFDVALVFMTAAHVPHSADIVAALRTVLQPRHVIAVSAESVIGGAREVQGSPALSVWAGALPGALPMRLHAEREAGGWVVGGLPDDRDLDGLTLVLFADPFSFPVDAFLAALREDRPGLTVVGGLASAGRRPGDNRLVLDGEIYRDGALGLLLPRGAASQAIVSQGCRPVGEPFIVTRSEGAVIHELGGRSPLDRLRDLFAQADENDRELLQRGLQVGLVIDEQQLEFTRGDFLVRDIHGLDQRSGSMAIGDEVAIGTTVQFQVRDAASADEDLRSLLTGVDGAGALVFTCTARGMHLFGEPHHDAALVAEHTGNAIAGLFCAGEFGPIGGRNFLHAYTASVLVFHR